MRRDVDVIKIISTLVEKVINGLMNFLELRSVSISLVLKLMREIITLYLR